MTYYIPGTRVAIAEDDVNADFYAGMLAISHKDGQLLDTLIGLAIVPAECFPEGVDDAALAVERLNGALSPLGATIAAVGVASDGAPLAWRMSKPHKDALESRLAAWI